jgi:tetratricopeptide (TPR) repeat protein
LDLYHELPEEIQTSNVGLLFRFKASVPLGETETNAAFDAFRKYQPTSSAIDLLKIDYHSVRKEYAQARDAMDRLNIRLGGEPYLLVMAGNAYVAEGKFTEAAENFERAISAEPTLADAYIAMLSLRVKQRDFPAARGAIEQLESHTSIHLIPKKFEQNPLYAEL